jgi:hypothetical protein
MTVLVEDPLIAGMAIRQTLPLHESSRRLRELYPECPRVYGIAVMGDLSRRRWWPLAEAVTTDRLQAMFEFAAEVTDSRAAVAQQLAATLAHVVVGRVLPLVVLEGRAWDTGLENLWVHVDSEGAIDWVGVVDPQLRALPDDPALADDGYCRLAQRGGADDLGRPPQPPRTGAAVCKALRRMRRCHVGCFDVAYRRRRRGQRCDPGAAAGRFERVDEHAPRAGRSRRVGWIRAARPRHRSDDSTEDLAKLGQPCLFWSRLKRN